LPANRIRYLFSAIKGLLEKKPSGIEEGLASLMANEDAKANTLLSSSIESALQELERNRDESIKEFRRLLEEAGEGE
jgi:hypothetical protein